MLVNQGGFEKYMLERISSRVEQEYDLTVKIEERHISLDPYFDPMRRQYDANKLMSDIDQQLSSENVKQLGLFRVDLFIPILTYIFGQAALKGKTGIASLYRLRNEHYGMKPDDQLLQNRFGKVIIHELGHMFGLMHCHVPTCVMRSSTYVEDIDQKSHNLCVKCRTDLEKMSHSIDLNL
ncbi:archaemetzincin family Zn-dependent metalloprotease [Bacteroidota bacterium]